MLWLILLITLAVLIWFRFLKPMNHFIKMGVKQSKPWPLVGDQWRTVFRQISFLESVEYYYNMFPGTRYSGFYQFSIPTLVIKDPDLLKQITVKDFDHFSDHRTFVDADVDPLWGGNLFALRGRKWKDMRATLSGSFTSSKMKNMFHLMNGAAENFVNFFLSKNEKLIEVEMKDTFTRFTNDVIATTAFGIEVDSLKCPNNAFFLMGKRTTDSSSLLRRLRFFAFLMMPKLTKLLKIGLFEKDISSFFYNTIKETIQVREEKGIVRQDMLNLLLEARKGIRHEYSEAIETGFATVKEYAQFGKGRQLTDLTDADIASQAMIFFFAGFDTISTAMCFGSYELAVNKEIQNKLRSEIVEAHRLNGGKVTYDSLLKMNYMDKVISEILRKWPPAPAVDRVVTQPYTIEPVNADEKPVNLKIGDVLWIPIYAYHRDPENFENPTKFDPERFSDENKSNIKPYTYIPFGSGPRNCIGSRFALLEIKALFYHLLLNFEIEPTKTTTVPLKLCTKSFNPSASGGFWFGLKPLRST
nr:cytochrome P450 CYP9Z52 [Dendroctonus valens]